MHYLLLLFRYLSCFLVVEALAAGDVVSPRQQHQQQLRAIIHQRTTTKQQIAKNLLAVCTHVQNPELYSSLEWADSSCLFNDDDRRRIIAATKDVRYGQILSLYPIHAVGFECENGNNNDNYGFIAYDINNKQDADYFGKNGKKMIRKNEKKRKKKASPRSSRRKNSSRRIRTDLTLPVELQNSRLFGTNSHSSSSSLPFYIDANPNYRGQRQRHSSVVPPVGWFGHLATSTAANTSSQSQAKDILKNEPHNDSNCRVIPLAHAAPFCCLVATRNITKGEVLYCNYTSDNDNVSQPKKNEDPQAQDLTKLLLQQYKTEIDELASYVQMSYEPLIKQMQQQQQSNKDSNNNNEIPPSSAQDLDDDDEQGDPPSFQYPFHTINVKYRGLKHIHTDPDIYVIPNFMSNDECDRLIAKATPHLKPCLAKNEDTGIVEQDPCRTSTNANIPRREVPGIVQRILNLLQPDSDGDYNGAMENRLEILQTLRYQNGQRFYPHTDGFNGPIDACGFQDSGRIATLFCYLNDMPIQSGGGTKFNLLKNLTIQPQKGMAVIHFPNTLGLEEDTRTEHEGLPIIGNEYEKWLLVTWLWRDPLSDERYSEQNLPSLSNDII